MSNTKNVKLGVCKIFFDGSDLGYTKGGVEVEVATETHKVEVDQFGKSPIDEVIMGRTVSVKAPLAETTLENLVKIMPGATLVTNGTKASGTVTFSGALTANDTITVNGAVFTAKAVPASAYEFAIGSSANDQASKFAAAINASIDARVVDIAAVAASAVVTLSSETTGVAGNAYTLAKTATAATTSGATLTGGTEATKAKASVTQAVGTSLLAVAKKLVLHPKGLPDGNKSEDFVVPLAMTPGAMSFAYKLEEERVFNCTFSGYPDPVTEVLFVVGDETAV